MRAASRTVASCSSCLEPKSAKTPLLLSWSSVARRPTDSASSPSTEAMSTVRRSTNCLVRLPRSTLPSSRVPAIAPPRVRRSLGVGRDRSGAQRRMVGHHRARPRRDLREPGVAHQRQPGGGESTPAGRVCGADGEGNPASRQAVRCSSDSSHQASCAACPACAIVLPADMSRSGLSHSTGAVGSASTGGSGSSRSVPETWSLTRSFGQPSRGPAGRRAPRRTSRSP